MSGVTIIDKIVVMIEETNVAKQYIKSVGADKITSTLCLEEAMGFETSREAQAALKVIMAVCDDQYRPTRNTEPFSETDGHRTITVMKVRATHIPIVSIILMPRG
jgi:hypothetical protein